MIDVSDLVFEYPSHRALDGIGLHIARGSVTALVGPNGAGKSTLLRCLAGLEQPLSGQIRVHGIDVATQPRQVHRHLGYLSDFFGLYERLTVAQGLEYAARATGLAPHLAQTRVAQVAQQLDLQPLLQRLPSQLSRGQRQRLAIGQAIVHQPAVLLLDEPASGLDPEARASLAQLMRQLQAQGMTLIVSSHILSELDEYCTHILALRAGRIESHAPLQPEHHGTQQDLQLFRIELAHAAPSAQWHAWLDASGLPEQPASAPDAPHLPAGTHTHTDTDTQLLWLPRAAPARAALLAHWVQRGMPVAALAAQRTRLQQHYIGQPAGTERSAT